MSTDPLPPFVLDGNEPGRRIDFEDLVEPGMVILTVEGSFVDPERVFDDPIFLAFGATVHAVGEIVPVRFGRIVVSGRASEARVRGTTSFRVTTGGGGRIVTRDLYAITPPNVLVSGYRWTVRVTAEPDSDGGASDAIHR